MVNNQVRPSGPLGPVASVPRGMLGRSAPVMAPQPVTVVQNLRRLCKCSPKSWGKYKVF